MRQNYWTSRALRTVPRRRFLAAGAAGVTGAGAFALIGCGDDDDDDGASPTSSPAGSSPTSAGTTATAEPTGQAVRGGTWNSAQGPDIPTLDPFATQSAITKGATAMVYSRMFVIEASAPSADGTIPLNPVGDTVDSYEAADDGLEYLFTLKPNVMFHPPVSRQLTAEDVVFSWERFSGALPGSTPSPTSNRFSMIESVEAVDDLTVRFVLNRPYGPLVDLLADANGLLMMPSETGTAFDPTQTMVGAGPFMFEEYQTGSVISYLRHPEWHGGPERPYLDRVVVNIVPEPATQLNQFLAGNLDVTAVSGLDIQSVQGSISDAQFLARDTSGLVGYVAFSRVNEQRADAPWTDPRVRQAMSMAINRDELLDLAYDVQGYEDAGIDVPRIWHGLLPISFGDAVLQPQGSEFEQYFAYDPDAAQALIDEAGGGFSTTMEYSTVLGAAYTTIAELLVTYWSSIGVNVTLEPVDYSSGFQPRTLRGEFDGLGMAGYAGIPTPGVFLESAFLSTSQTNQSKVNDPVVDGLLADYYAELDPDGRNEHLLELQRHVLENMYYVPNQWGAALGVSAYQPNVHGPTEFASFGYGNTSVELPNFWKDA